MTEIIMGVAADIAREVVQHLANKHQRHLPGWLQDSLKNMGLIEETIFDDLQNVLESALASFLASEGNTHWQQKHSQLFLQTSLIAYLTHIFENGGLPEDETLQNMIYKEAGKEATIPNYNYLNRFSSDFSKHFFRALQHTRTIQDFANQIFDRNLVRNEHIKTRSYILGEDFLLLDYCEELPAFVRRDKLMDEVKSHLTNLGQDQSSPCVVTVFGSGGFGKTTLVQACCQDPEIKKKYIDGILWVTIGADRTVEDVLGAILAVLTTRKQLGELTDRINNVIKDRRLLIVFDDVWDRPMLDSLLKIGENCDKLITTRSDVLATRLPEFKTVEVKELNRYETADLLIQMLPEPKMIDDDAERVRELREVQEAPRNAAVRQPFFDLGEKLGGWALMVALAGGWLYDEIKNEKKSLKVALTDFEGKLTKYGFTAFENLDLGRTSDNAEKRKRNIRANLEVSLERLGDNRTRALELCVFPQANYVPFNTLKQLWQATSEDDKIDADDIRKLMRRLALFREYIPKSKQVRLHDVIRAAFEEILMQDIKEKAKEEGKTPNEANKKAEEHIQSIHMKLVMSWGDLTNLPDAYAWQNVIWHLIQANQVDDAKRALLNFRFLRGKIKALGASALLADFNWDELGADQSLQIIESAIGWSLPALDSAEQLQPQLLGRLIPKWIGDAGKQAIRQFINDATNYEAQEPLWLPANQDFVALRPAGGDLLQTFLEHGAGVQDVLELEDTTFVSRSTEKSLLRWELNHRSSIGSLDGHNGAINGAMIMQTDSAILSWSDDATLRLWDLDGQQKAIFEGHDKPVRCAVPYGDKKILSWSDDKTLIVWYIDPPEKGKFISDHLSEEGHTDTIYGAFKLQIETPEQTLSWSKDRTLRLWERSWSEEEGTYIYKRTKTLPDHHSPVVGATQLKDGQIVSWAKDGSMILWKSDMECRERFHPGHRDKVNGAKEVSIVEDGQTHSGLLSWSEDTTLRLWAISAPKTVRESTLQGLLAFDNPDEDPDELVSEDPAVRLLATFSGHEKAVVGAIETKDGFLSWSQDHTIRLWDTEGNQMFMLADHTKEVTGVLDLSGVGGSGKKQILSWSADTTLRLWDMIEKRGQGIFRGHQQSIRGASTRIKEGHLLSWSDDATLRLWYIDDKKPRTLSGHAEKLLGVRQLHDQRVLSWSEDTNLCVWELETGECVPFEEHGGTIRGALETQSGNILSWADEDYLYLWTPDGEFANEFGHKGPVQGALEIEAGTFVSWADKDVTRLWNSDGEEIHQFEKHGGDVLRIVKLGKDRLLCWGKDKTLRVWNLNGETLAVSQKQEDRARSVTLLDDYRVLFLSGDSGVVVWNLETNEEIRARENTFAIHHVMLEAPDTLLLWGRDDPIISLWNMDTDEVIDSAKLPYSISGVTRMASGQLLSWSGESGLITMTSPDLSNNEKPIEAHSESVLGVEVLPTGNLLSWSTDQTIRLWDTDGQLITTYYMDGEPTTTPVILADGTLAVGDSLGYVHLLRPNRALANRL